MTLVLSIHHRDYNMKLRTGRRTSKVKASKRQGSQGKSCEQRRKLRFGSSSGYNLHDSDAEVGDGN